VPGPPIHNTHTLYRRHVALSQCTMQGGPLGRAQLWGPNGHQSRHAVSAIGSGFSTDYPRGTLTPRNIDTPNHCWGGERRCCGLPPSIIAEFVLPSATSWRHWPTITSAKRDIVDLPGHGAGSPRTPNSPKNSNCTSLPWPVTNRNGCRELRRVGPCEQVFVSAVPRDQVGDPVSSARPHLEHLMRSTSSLPIRSEKMIAPSRGILIFLFVS
jgi:hypothetical protein